MKTLILLLNFFAHGAVTKSHINPADAILGKWETVKNNLIVEVYKDHNTYKAKVIWFKNTHDKANPSDTWRDEKNPNKSLRQRKVLGMEVLQNLVYNPTENLWEDGKIYDSTTGKTWDSSAWISSGGLLRVRGFWHFQFIGQTMVFKKTLNIHL